MNNTEQYHTGRAAAYYTMTGALTALLRRYEGGPIPATEVQKLRDQAESWQVRAEDDANQATPAPRGTTPHGSDAPSTPQ
jgi:hypothetical protein